MFEDSLVESTGRIRTRSSRYAAGSLLVEAALVSTFILIPSLYPDALPRKFLNVPLIAPPPPVAAAPVERVAASPVSHSEEFQHTLIAPPTIPTRIHIVVDPLPPAPLTGDPSQPMGNGVTGVPLLPAVTPPPIRPVHPAQLHGPLHVSSGVAAGQLVVPIQPRYPAIALAANIQGTVVVAAIISTEGRIESLHVLSGPPMLTAAAVDAIRQARYRPWTLNGQPVEVETTINVVFSLGSS